MPIAHVVIGVAPKSRSGYTLSIFKELPNGNWVLARDASMLAPDSGDGAHGTATTTPGAK